MQDCGLAKEKLEIERDREGAKNSEKSLTCEE